MSRLRPLLSIAFIAALTFFGCGEDPPSDEDELVRVHVPAGTTFSAVSDSLSAHGIIRAPTLFRLYARVTGADQAIKPGVYGFAPSTGWRGVLDDLVAGNVLTVQLVIPEGWDLEGIAPLLATLTGEEPDSILYFIADTAAARKFDVPGPTLEGYLYPATYTLPVEMGLDAILGYMTEQYKVMWTPERRARAEELGLSEREAVTLASIIEKEARVRDEMPMISAVFHNRLRIGMPLQADPTVQYALGEHQARLLYAHIDRVADHPYNTYRNRGLPPGPIASPSALALDAALEPADAEHLYFVARPDGSHMFTRSLAEHNRARQKVRQDRRVSGGPARGAAKPR